MEIVKGDPFAEVLAAGRSRYNTQFAVARMGQPRLRADVFLNHLRTTMQPIVEAVHRHDPERIEAVLGAPIGSDADHGVIDSDQRVFGYQNLMVCDGSAVPANPGVNPSLTICAMTERAMSKIPAKAG